MKTHPAVQAIFNRHVSKLMKGKGAIMAKAKKSRKKGSTGGKKRKATPAQLAGLAKGRKALAAKRAGKTGKKGRKKGGGKKRSGHMPLALLRKRHARLGSIIKSRS